MNTKTPDTISSLGNEPLKWVHNRPKLQAVKCEIPSTGHKAEIPTG